MRAESRMRQRVVVALRGLDPVSVENSVHPGTPDVSYAHGWLELKHAAKWPSRADTPLRLPHFTPQQRVWLLRRTRAGGRAFLLLAVTIVVGGSVGHEWLLFRGDVAAEFVGRVPKEELRQRAVARWAYTLDDAQLRTYLCA